MAGVLIFADQKEGKFRKVIFEMLGEGRKLADHLGEELQAVLMGQNVEEYATVLGEAGADKVFVIDDPLLANYTTDGFANALVKLISTENPSIVLFPNNAVGKDLAPAVAQKLNAGQASDVIAIEYDNGLRFKRPIYAGKAFAHVSFTSNRPMIVTIRPKAFEAATPQPGKQPAIVRYASELDASSLRQIVKDVVRKASGRVELTEADIVVSGGRGMKSAENFKILEELADVLGAAVGASRAAVDEGWREPQYQVGQTGKVVSPTLYIACGISGAIQHLAGMSSSKYIVAINKDPEAEIFKVADYGIVADLFEVVPVLTEEFKKALAE